MSTVTVPLPADPVRRQRLADKLLATASAEEVRAALVQHFARTQAVPDTLLAQGAATGPLLAAAVPERTHALLRRAGALSLKAVEGLLEALMDKAHRKGHGVVYTPTHIIDYLVEETLTPDSLHGKRPPRLIDPCCGSGGFLVRAARYLLAHRPEPLPRLLEESLFGIDLDPRAVANATLILELLQAEAGFAPTARLNLAVADTLLDPAARLCREFGGADFDAVITNPPYVKLQNLAPAYRERLIRRFPNEARGNFSLALLFLLAGRDLLGPEGRLGVITQNNLFTSLAGAPVRQALQEAGALYRIIDFGGYPVFPQVSAYTCLVFLDRKPRATFQFGICAPAGLADLHATPLGTFSTAALDARKWRLLPEKHAPQVARIEAVGRPLGEIAAIRVGFATLRDEVFLARMDGKRCLAGVAEVEIEAALTRPAVKVAAIGGDGEVAKAAGRIIFPYREEGGRFVLIDEATLARRYPRGYAYLKSCEPLLRARDKGARAYEGWYAWGRTQGMRATGPKLLTKTFNTRPRFYHDAGDHLFCNGYGIWLATPCGALDLPLLQVLLNSELMHYYISLTSVQLTGGYLCYQKNFLERFGVPALTAEEAASLRTLTGEARETFLCDLYGISRPLVRHYLKQQTPP